MTPSGNRLTRFVEGPWLIPLAILLVGVRFVASTVTAYLGIRGINTTGIDLALEAYSIVLLAALALLVGFLLPKVIASSGREPAVVLFLGLAAWATVQWLGVLVPPIRVVGGVLGAWADFLLGITVAAALAVLTTILARRLGSLGVSPRRLQGIRALGFGFAAAYAFRSVRLLDFVYLFGRPLPSGVTWLLDFGPSLLLVLLAVLFWIPTLRLRPIRIGPWLRGFALPVLLALLALAAATGVLGGFIIANVLSWGGSYIVFSPTNVSLPVVGFGTGAFLSTAWAARRHWPGPEWRLAFGGVAIALLAGIQTSVGTLPSFVGILAGLVCAARGVSMQLHPPGPGTPTVGP